MAVSLSVSLSMCLHVDCKSIARHTDNRFYDALHICRMIIVFIGQESSEVLNFVFNEI